MTDEIHEITLNIQIKAYLTPKFPKKQTTKLCLQNFESFNKNCINLKKKYQ